MRIMRGEAERISIYSSVYRLLELNIVVVLVVVFSSIIYIVVVFSSISKPSTGQWRMSMCEHSSKTAKNI